MADSGIYEIVNLRNGKRYVGSAIDLEKRQAQHFQALRRGKHHNAALTRAWVKYGREAFEFRVIERCERAVLIEREQHYIDIRSEYNCSPTAGSTLGLKYSDEARARMSASRIGRGKGVKQSSEHVEKRAARHRGKKRSEETRRKIAEKAKGRKFVRFNDDYRAKLSVAFKGRPKSVEHMERLQAGRRAYVSTEEERVAKSESLKRAYAEGRRSKERPAEYRAKIAATLRAKAQSPEVRERLREQARQAWANRTPDERAAHMEKMRACRKR